MVARALKKPASPVKRRRLLDEVDSTIKLRVCPRKKGNERGAINVDIRCGCCSEKIRVTRDEPPLYKHHTGIEIDGVYASLEEWQRALLPILGLKEVRLTLTNGQKAKVWVNNGIV